MGLTHARTKLWTIAEYRSLFEKGILPEDARVELIEGEIIEMAAHNPPHSHALMHSNEVLVLAFRETHWVASQTSVEVSPISQPEPDFGLIPKEKVKTVDYIRHADLVMEVADSSLAYDRKQKASMYAKWNLREYWILNVRKRQLEVHRDPRADASQPYGFGWACITVVPESGTVSPLCRPDVVLKVADLL